MKNSRIPLPAVCLFLMLLTGAASADITLQTGVNYDWWDDTAGNSGHQTYVPLLIDAQYRDFSARVLGGYASTSRTIAGVGSASMGAVLDTKLNLSYAVADKLPVDLLIGLDFNLPTGKTGLSNQQLTLVMDPDLVSITRFGEGFNVNPTLSLAKQWGPWSALMGLGYLWRGEYDYSESVSDYNPGDIFNVNGEVRYEFKPGRTGRLYATYAWYGMDQIQGNDTFQQGQFFLAGAGFSYTEGKWGGDVDIKGIFRAKSKVIDAAGALATEPARGFGDEVVATYAGRYLFDGKSSVNWLLQWLYFNQNDYPSNSPFFVGDRNKFTLGLGAATQLAKGIEAQLKLRGFVMHDGPRAAQMLFSPTTERSYKGFSVAAMVTGTF